MTEEQTRPRPKVIISYSWTSEEHKQWVRELAERLMGNGVDALLDIWELKEGHNIYAYMERMVLDPQISKVLMICDKSYAEKANAKKGGVGTESLIISPEIYAKTDQEKFIPIVTEFDESNRAVVPVFLEGRYYIDMSNDEKTAGNYDQLLRNIFNRPLYQKPAIGEPPQYLFEESVSSKTKYKIETVKDAIRDNRSNLTGLVTDYLRSFISSLEDFKFEIKTHEGKFDEKVLSSFASFLPLRDELIDFILFTSLHVDEQEIYQNIFRFFEELLQYKDPPAGTAGYDDIRDNFRLMMHELFLYLIAALIKNQKYTQANIFLSQEYFHPNGRRRTNEPDFLKFNDFCAETGSLEYGATVSRSSITAKLLKERASNSELKFDRLMETDLILFLRSLIDQTPNDWIWTPKTLAHAEYYGAFELFARAASKRQFENLKILLNITSKQQLIDKIEAAREDKLFGEIHLKSATVIRLANIDNLDTRP
jgi:hypothetical protein